MQNFTNLQVWRSAYADPTFSERRHAPACAHAFTIDIYKITKDFPSEEKFGLTSQLRRASISIESNLAEGCGRNNDKEFARFVSIAQGSAFEARCQLILAKDLGYVSEEKFSLLEQKILEINRMLNAFDQKLRAKS